MNVTISRAVDLIIDRLPPGLSYALAARDDAGRFITRRHEPGAEALPWSICEDYHQGKAGLLALRHFKADCFIESVAMLEPSTPDMTAAQCSIVADAAAVARIIDVETMARCAPIGGPRLRDARPAVAAIVAAIPETFGIALRDDAHRWFLRSVDRNDQPCWQPTLRGKPSDAFARHTIDRKSPGFVWVGVEYDHHFRGYIGMVSAIVTAGHLAGVPPRA